MNTDPFDNPFFDVDDHLYTGRRAPSYEDDANTAFSAAGSADGQEQISDEDSASAYAAREAERAANRTGLYERLNVEQEEAVFMGFESSLVLAAAGSGKTSVLTARVARLVTHSDSNIPAESIMAVTFTNKASQEMKHRLRSLLNKSAVKNLWVGTFHSLCNRILRENYAAAGLPKAFAILDTDGQESLVRNILKDYGLTKASVKAAAKLKSLTAPDLLSGGDPLAPIGEDADDDGEGDEFITPSQCVKRINAKKERGIKPDPTGEMPTPRSSDTDQIEAVYSEYEARLAKQGLLDFQDLLSRAVGLLKSDPDVQNHYQDKFRAILVDEFQDTNDIQYEWLNLMKGPKCHLTAVGDDDQSIYAFRGADPKNMGRFLREMTVTPAHPDGRLIRLEQNYRSLPHILEAANAIIERNTNRLGKVLRTAKRDGGEKLDLITFGNGLYEASAIARGVYALVKEQSVPPSEVAILYRTNLQSRLIEQELNKLGIPLTVYGGFRFYERQEIKNVMAYLDLIGDISRDLSFVRVANFPPRGIGERTLEELRQAAQSEKISMIEMVEKRVQMMTENPASIGNLASQKKLRQLSGFMNTVLDLADAAVEMPLSKLIEKVVDSTGISKHYIDEAGGSKSSTEEAEERLGNIAELVSAAKQFELENPQFANAAEQLPEYLSFVALMSSTSESDMSRKNTVSLMTVHSSKGLEFDHVYITGLEEGIFPHSRAINEDEERGNGRSLEEGSRMVYVGGVPQDTYQGEEDGPGLQEERRLMYVALTRARKTLVVTHAESRMVNGDSKSAEPSRFLMELPVKRLNRIDDVEVSRDRSIAMMEHPPEPDRGGLMSKAATQPAKPVAGNPYGFPVARVIAIIGTAGRDKNKPLDRNLWDRMLADARKRVTTGDALVSGGAAWADHLAVRLYLEGCVNHLALHLPAPIENGVFAGPEMESAGSAANYYHGIFKRNTGVDGLQDIQKAITKGAVVTFEPAAKGYRAMFERNSKVASGASFGLAYTFGQGELPDDGGTKDTWDRFTGDKLHIPLGSLTAIPSTTAAVAPATATTSTNSPGLVSKLVSQTLLAANSPEKEKPWKRKWLSEGQSATPKSALPAVDAPSRTTMNRLKVLSAPRSTRHQSTPGDPKGLAGTASDGEDSAEAFRSLRIR